MSIELVRAHATNFLLYETLDIPLDRRGLVFFAGQWPTDPARSNASGKTSGLSLVPWILWEKLLRDMRRDVSAVIRRGSDECSGTLEGRINGVPFTITRTRNGSSCKLTASFSSNSRTADVQEDINRVFGTFDLAQNTIFLGQKKALEFLSATDGTRRKLMEDLLNIDVWRRAQKRISEDSAEFEQKRVAMEYERNMLVMELDKLLSEKRHQYDLEIMTRLATIAEKQSLAASLSSRITEKEAGLVPLNDALYEYTTTLETAQKEIQALNKRITDVNRALGEAKNAVANGTRILESLKRDTCPTCGQSVATDEDYIKESQASLDAITAVMTATQEKLDGFVEQRNTLEGRASSTRSAKAMANQDLSHRLAEIQDLKKQYRQQDGEIVVLMTEVSSLEQQRDSQTDDTEAVENLRERIQNRTEALESLVQGLAALKICYEGFGSKGVPAMRIAESLPLLVEEINAILDVLSGGTMSLDILAADAAKEDGRMLERLTFVVWENGREIYMEECSEGQRRRIIIALFLAATRIQRTLTGSWWNVRAMDELFDSLDGPGIEAVMEVLSALKGSVPTILVTSHNSAFRDLEGFDQQWVVERGASGSVLSVSS